MSFDLNGKSFETTANGYLENSEEWTKELGEVIAAEEDVELTDKHWDLINFLRDDFAKNSGKQPNTRGIIKAMTKTWGEKPSQRDLYDLFPGDPSKQGGRIAGLPESRRKGGY